MRKKVITNSNSNNIISKVTSLEDNNVIVKRMFKDSLPIQILSVATGGGGVIVSGLVIGACLGVNEMAAYGLAMPIITIITAIASVFTTGITMLVGRTVGMGKAHDTNVIVSTCIFGSAALGLILLLILVLLSNPLAVFLGATAELQPMTSDFILGFGFSVPAIFLDTLCMPIMQIDGDKNRVYVASIVMVAVSVILSILNGVLINWGLFGMGLATTLCYYAALFLFIMHFVRKKGSIRLSLKKLNFKYFLEMVKYGLPNALQLICRCLLIFTLNILLLRISDTNAVAIYSAIMSVANLCMALGTGVGTTTALVGSIFYGEKDKNNLKKLLKTGIYYSIILNVIFGIFWILIASLLMDVFLGNADQEVYEMGVLAFRLYASSMIIFSLNTNFRYYYQCINRLKFSYVYIFLNNYALIALSAWVLGSMFGTNGVWTSYLSGEILSLIFVILFALILSRNAKGFVNKLLAFPQDFAREVSMSKAYSISNEKGVSICSKMVYFVSMEYGSSKKTAILLSLSVEEIGKNITTHGFTERKKNNSIDLRLLKENNKWTLSFRDNCNLFDPTSYVNDLNDEDPVAHIGIRLVNKFARSIVYMPTLKMNTLQIVIEE